MMLGMREERCQEERENDIGKMLGGKKKIRNKPLKKDFGREKEVRKKGYKMLGGKI